MTRVAPTGTLKQPPPMPMGMAQMPGIAPPSTVPLPNLPAPQPGAVNVGAFTDRAPTATPYGNFTGPDPAAVANDPYFKFRAAEGQKAIERAAAARGTLLSGGTLKALEGYRQGLASEEAGKSFDRALGTYTTNRDTNAQNFGQSMGTFRGNLDAFGANTGATLGAFNANTAATLGAGRLNTDTAFGLYDRAQDAAADQQGYQQQVMDTDFASQAQAARQNFLAGQQPGIPKAPWPGRIQTTLKMPYGR